MGLVGVVMVGGDGVVLDFGFWIEIVGCISGRGLGIGGQPGAAMHQSGMG